MTCTKKHGKAFTLTEVLVVITVIVMLLVLLLPAIQRIREASRRMSCRSKLRQLGVACQSYLSSFKVFPPGVISGGSNPNLMSPHVFLLPSIGSETTYNAINFVSVGSTPMNSTACGAVISTFLCPTRGPVTSENVTADFPTYGTSYPACIGSGSWDEPDGVFYFSGAPTIEPAQISDGLSHTALFSEWVPTGALHGEYWNSGSFGFMVFVEPRPATRGAFVQRCLAFRPPFSDVHPVGNAWHAGIDAMYNHQLPPNRISCYGAGPFHKLAFTASSLHDGVVHLVFADAHVETVSESVDLDVWRSYGSRAGNDNW